jgi:hypothetical protein
LTSEGELVGDRASVGQRPRGGPILFAYGTAEPAKQQRLVYPAYLDVPMMVSYLATLDGGVRFEDQITVHQKDSSGKDREVSTRVGLPSVLSLLNLSASGRISGRASEESSEEIDGKATHGGIAVQRPAEKARRARPRAASR